MRERDERDSGPLRESGPEKDPGPLKRPDGGGGADDMGVDCRVFEDQLDALVRGSLPEEGMRQLRLHAAECDACGMQLRVQEHLVGPSLEELEGQVPEALLGTVWAGVREGVERARSAPAAALQGFPEAGGEAGPGAPTPIRRRSRWMVPALAAASLVLLISTGYLAVELGRVRAREESLAQQVSDQQRWMSVLADGATADPVARTAALAGRDPWVRALTRQESITLGGLETLLRRMPGHRIVLTRSQVESVLSGRNPGTVPFLRDALSRAAGGGGVTARDLLRALETVTVNDDVRLPTAELAQLLS